MYAIASGNRVTRELPEMPADAGTMSVSMKRKRKSSRAE